MLRYMVLAMVVPLAYATGAVIELTGQTPRVIYGQLDSSDALTLTRNTSEDKLVCSGEFEAADLRIAGTSTTVADLIAEVATLRQDMAAVKAFVGMMPPPASPPPLPQCQLHMDIYVYCGLSNDRCSAGADHMMLLNQSIFIQTSQTFDGYPVYKSVAPIDGQWDYLCRYGSVWNVNRAVVSSGYSNRYGYISGGNPNMPDGVLILWDTTLLSGQGKHIVAGSVTCDTS